MNSRIPVEPVYRSGLDWLCDALIGNREVPLDLDLMARIRRAAGLLTHPAAVTSDFTHSVEALTSAGAHLEALFGPEHGVRGDAPDGRAVPSSVDARTGLPIYSLYRGGSATAQVPVPAMLRGLEVLIVDLQDVGARFYTFASTVSHCMTAAAEAGVPVVVLDRPNPIGRPIEGPILRPEFASFVGLHPLPIRHGCSMGELALLFHRAYGVGEEPSVVPVESVGSEQWAVSSEARGGPSGLPTAWIPPSPNMPSPLTALVYPGTCLLEGTNLSEGRGTARPFEWLGAPWIDVEALVARLQAYDLPGSAFRPIYFAPTISKWAGETCAGVHVHLTEVDRFRPVLTGVAILAAVRSLWPEQFQWLEHDGWFSVDRLAGTDNLRGSIDRGEDPRSIAATWKDDETAFRATRAMAELYP